MSFEGGYTSAVNSASNRQSQDAQRQAALQQLAQVAQLFQQQQEQQKRKAAAQSALPALMAQLAPPPAAAGPQPPPPGAPSVPMAPPGPPPPPQGPPGMGQLPPPPGLGFASPGGAPPPGAQKPMNGPPSPAPGAGGPPMPAPGWKSLPAPPGDAPTSPGGLPPPPGEGAVVPKQLLSVTDLAKSLAAKGIKGQEAFDLMEAWKPFMDSENKQQLEQMKVHNAAQAAALKTYAQIIRDAETKRHHAKLEEQGDKRLGQGQERINITVGGKDTGDSDLSKDDETRRFMAEQYWAGDNSVMQNLGRGAQGAKNITALRKEIVAVGKKMGKSAKDLAAAQAEFQGMKAGERTLGTRTANVEMAVTEAENMAQIVLDTSKKFDRTNFMPVNKALKAFEDNTGSTESRQFGASLNSFINAYSRAISPSGVPTVHDKEHAREMLSTADSHEQVVAIMQTLRQEMTAAKKSPRQVKDAMRDGFTGTGGGKGDYVELRKTADGRTLGKKADGTVEEVK